MAAISREASKAGISINRAVQICAERGWQSFKADWLPDGDRHMPLKPPKMPPKAFFDDHPYNPHRSPEELDTLYSRWWNEKGAKL